MIPNGMGRYGDKGHFMVPSLGLTYSNDAFFSARQDTY
jgi:hypothetical protein